MFIGIAIGCAIWALCTIVGVSSIKPGERILFGRNLFMGITVTVLCGAIGYIIEEVF